MPFTTHRIIQSLYEQSYKKIRQQKSRFRRIKNPIFYTPDGSWNRGFRRTIKQEFVDEQGAELRVRTWEVELGGRVEPEAAPGGEQRPDHLDAAAAAGPGRRAGDLAVGGRRPGRGPPERHVAQPQAPGPRSGVLVLLLPPVSAATLLLLLRQDQQRLAVRVGRRRTYGRGRALLGRRGRRRGV